MQLSLAQVQSVIADLERFEVFRLDCPEQASSAIGDDWVLVACYDPEAARHEATSFGCYTTWPLSSTALDDPASFRLTGVEGQVYNSPYDPSGVAPTIYYYCDPRVLPWLSICRNPADLPDEHHPDAEYLDQWPQA